MRWSSHPDVLGFIALATRADVELDGLTLFERAVAAALNVGVMDEHIVTALSGDESVALFRIEEFHCSCRHCTLYLSIAAT